MTIASSLCRCPCRCTAAAQLGRQRSSNTGTASLPDGLIGFSLKGAPYGVSLDLIEWSNASGTPVLAMDAPSGLDLTTGTVFEPAIVATVTMTLALPKKGLRSPGVEAYVGKLYLADIGVPPALYSKALGLEVGPIFATGDIVRMA